MKDPINRILHSPVVDFICFDTLVQILFGWVFLRSVLFVCPCFFQPLVSTNVQTKIHLETAQKPPNDHLVDGSQLINLTW